MQNKIILLLLLASGYCGFAQVNDSSYVAIDSVAVDSTEIPIPDNGIKNAKAIYGFYQKLSELETKRNRKINIVHIGDSHIQADLMTNKVRRDLQEVFGNAGRGFLFPHSLARTNGAWDVRFTSNGNWESLRNIYPPNGSPVGLSGISLTAKSDDFAIELNAKEDANRFSTLKIITPGNRDSFDAATAKKTITFESEVPKKITHKIKRGEALSIIAEKYNVSMAEIKKVNGLKNNNIRAGKTLKIPTDEREKKKIERSEFIPLELLSDDYSHFYKSENPLDKIYLLPKDGVKEVVLSGVVLENDMPGIIYHGIGVNGAKLSDYNKYPLFFTQLKALQPDLVVVSLGTNESFDKLTSQEYLMQLYLFLQNVKTQNPGVSILVATPPPSLFKRRFPNTFAADYAQKILDASTETTFAVWDLYSQFGGLYGVNRNAGRGYINTDRVHYTKTGYEKQGDLLSEAILKAYQDFKSGKQ